MTEDDPYTLSGPQSHDLWAESMAELVLERDPEDPIVTKGGISPSGVPHLGNMNEIARGYFVARALRDRGRAVKQIFTADDRDPLRKLPRKLAGLDGSIVGLGDVDAGALGRNLGKPYTSIPDPFGCCDSYGAHFSTLIERSADALEIPVETVSNTALYESGAFEDVTRYLLAHREQAREVLGEHQEKVDEEYVPFRPICAECGHVTETNSVRSVDLDAGTVEYVCTDVEAGDRIIEGCGHEGRATLREGKLPWRFEWPAQWHVLDVDFEPFGKDHAEGSWPSGADITRQVLGEVPPVPMAYEWFTLDGAPFSSSAGHVVMAQDVLEFLEPEVLRYFFTKDPSKARDFSIERADQLVDEFDEFERGYFEESVTSHETTREANTAYPAIVDSVSEQPIRLPYTFAAVLGMTDDATLREAMARREGHLPENASDRAIERALERVEYARTWAERTDNAYNYRLAAECPAVEFDSDIEAALDDLASVVEREASGEEIQSEIFETAREHDISPGDLFTAGYRLFFGTEQGPKLGPFLAELDREFVVKRLRREA
ncbi:lysine--tRNA ligase [Halobacteriales archaeon QS_3_64_16]|nr:MAG: lysine--tRNA ligase [Halobacteriales archaeon QS_3_64_16]